MKKELGVRSQESEGKKKEEKGKGEESIEEGVRSQEGKGEESFLFAGSQLR
ncbi:hypothetical protein [Okeania sp. SIO2B3]|uniref:hypothetical protein n=1 Tax=Okeania sp. SIO2B3 TaxID=2607784 RepID=UPI0013BFD392|nr:hypothetical protein [Okeania sp. SIO2B3]NET40446.1 hypothetical protein [Okeania sp. SIO2B3]